jgi:hypothetical protein
MISTKNNFRKKITNNLFKITLMLILISSIIIFSGCGSISGKDAKFVENYFVGKKGLSLEFVRQSPPAQIYQNQEFNVHVILKNEGAHDVFNNSAINFDFTIDNYAFSKFSLLPLKPKNGDALGDRQIRGKSNLFPYGESTDFALANIVANPVRDNFESFNTELFLTMCYPYKTNFAKQVCIDTDINDLDLENKICSNVELNYNDGQGAPIAVTRITPSMIPRGNFVYPQFTITVKNMGKGIVFEPKYSSSGDYTYTCSKDANVNLVKINAYIQDKKLQCIPSLITLVNGEGKTNCAINESLSTRSNFYALMQIDLEYNYQEIFSKKIQIMKTDSLAFTDLNFKFKTCQNWEHDNGDGTCINLCEYCAKNPRSTECVDNMEDDEDKTVVGENYACVYNQNDCALANTYNTDVMNRNNRCINRINLCAPFEFCGIPMCTNGNNNYKPKIKTMTGNINDPYVQSESKDTIKWFVSDSNDNMNAAEGSLFDERNLYPDSKRTCGLKVNSNNVPIGYYSFINETDTCDGKTFKEVASMYGSGIYPAWFTIEIEKDSSNNNKQYVCLKAEDKQGLSTISKYKIESNNVNTRLIYD